MKKLWTLILAVFVCVAMLTSACSNGNNGAPGESPAVSQTAGGSAVTDDFSGKTLTVANWKGYGSDADYGELAFEQKYNCNVEHVYFTSLEEMMTMLKTGGLGTIDVCLPNSQYIKPLRDQNLIQPIDISKVSTYANLMESLTSFADANGENGEVYAVPWTWGTTSLGYNTDAIPETITSLSALWDSKYAGKVALFDDYNTEIMMTAMYLGEDPYNPDLEKVKAALLEIKANTKTYWASYDDFIKPYTSGEIVIGNMWTGIASQLKSAGQPVAYVYPEEGTVGWTDFWAIAKDAPNYDLACKWVEFMTDIEFQTAFATDVNAHCPVNETVLNGLTDEQKQILWIYPEAPTNIVLQAYQDDASRQAWLDLWNEVKAG
ncbi:MAG TPA: extracellular solute-binding protein [Clostridia bacterium]|nr:extracellular solute-binding protein [Clostridia bacterium]